MPRDTTDQACILAWARQRHVLMEIVQEYRFARRQGEGAERARHEAAALVARTDPTIPRPMTYALILLEWAEQEHRDWFWRCCRGKHAL